MWAGGGGALWLLRLQGRQHTAQALLTRLPLPPLSACTLCPGNAVRMAAATVEAILAAAPTARLVSMHGGDKRNAIPRECSATVVVRQSPMCSLGKRCSLHWQPAVVTCGCCALCCHCQLCCGALQSPTQQGALVLLMTSPLPNPLSVCPGPCR